MKLGQQFLIFAQKNKDGTYSILGGPQGRFEYKNGLLNSLHNTSIPHQNMLDAAGNTTDDSSICGVDIKNESAEDLKSEVEDILEKIIIFES